MLLFLEETGNCRFPSMLLLSKESGNLYMTGFFKHLLLFTFSLVIEVKERAVGLFTYFFTFTSYKISIVHRGKKLICCLI